MALPPDDGRPWRLDLADSEVASLDTHADGWVLRLSVACLRPVRPRLGAGDETVWWPDVRIEARGHATGRDHHLRGRVVHADLHGAGCVDPVSLPWRDGPLGPCHGTLRAAQGEVRLEALALRLTLSGGDTGRPSMAC
jgi:hypothetical protein